MVSVVIWYALCLALVLWMLWDGRHYGRPFVALASLAAVAIAAGMAGAVSRWLA